ncbi:acetoacetyl-CoA synthetase [Paenochrobactrum gallinarii]|uniref:Acetoacetyl-CoA synthetase n=1 Tax=Paenochrobactrum gallinarii TaxID=643673 RepID=A0A841M4F2_9HYPH|nr:acetoacetate--CoA ligase [Paenochrobactrum gallinarii]MBB6261038.1 acetoacetyl-CoA synthetase [Paenochrobactrum gallinarii]
MNEAIENRIIWHPSRARIEASALFKFAEKTRTQHGCEPDDYQGLLNWSVSAPEAFYSALWDELDIIGEKGERAVATSDNIRDVRFFPDSRLNYAENMLREPDKRLAIIAHRDDGTRRTITRKELYDKVSSLAQALQAMGVSKGDRVGAIVTHDIEAIIGYLATSSLGAIWSSCSPDFGPASASDRLSQIAPKVLIAVATYQYAGKKIDVLPTIREVCATAKPEQLILISEQRLEAVDGVATHQFDALLQQYSPRKIDFVPMPFNAPLAILYSSGTTGVPKCITHSAGGLLLQHLKELKLQSDIQANERFFYFTTCGWMMWNWQVSALALGATLITYDGNPAYPAQSRLIDLIDAEQIATFGTSAKFIDACNNAGLSPIESHDLSSLRTILSTGSALIPSAFDYIYQKWKNDVHLASISGGTDICACFLGGNPLQAVWRGELQGAMLGMDLDVLDDAAQPLPRPEVPSENGQSGELVCRNAHLSMPVKFWGDDDGSRYHAAYFERFTGLWAHGDFAEKRFSGGYIIHGRSDTTLNPGGVRIGTSEIYRQVETIDAVEEAVTVGQDIHGDQRIVLFVKLKAHEVLTDELRQTIRSRIRSGASPRHVPAKIIAISAIPRTRSGKISEIAVRDTIHGRTVKNLDALMNPEALALYQNIAELKD